MIGVVCGIQRGNKSMEIHRLVGSYMLGVGGQLLHLSDADAESLQ